MSNRKILLPPSGTAKQPRWTPLDRAFVREYLVDCNATQAYIRAQKSLGKKRVPYASAQTHGPKGLRKPLVRAALDEALAARRAEAKDRGTLVVEEAHRLARARLTDAFGPDGVPLPLADLPEDVKASLAQVEVVYLDRERLTDDGRTVVERVPVVAKLKLHDKRAAAELALKVDGLLREKVELTGDEGGPLVVEIRSLAPVPVGGNDGKQG